MNEMAEALDRAQQRLREQTPPGAYLTVQEVASLARCGHHTVRRAIANGQLEAFRPAHKLLIRELDARAWIESRSAKGAVTARPSRRADRSAPGSVERLRKIEENLA